MSRRKNKRLKDPYIIRFKCEKVQSTLTRYFRSIGKIHSDVSVVKISLLSRLVSDIKGKKPDEITPMQFLTMFAREIDPNQENVHRIAENKKAWAIWKSFYNTQEWKALRYAALKAAGGSCQCCGATAKSSGKPLHVDHIKPRSKFPELALDRNNLQVLCEPCNIGKSNKDQTDWRSKGATVIDIEIIRFNRENGI